MDINKLTEITADIVAAHVSNNSVAVSDLPNLIRQVHSALAGLEQGITAEQEAKTPVVSVKASVKPDYIICMECGRKQKALKRHLQTAHGMDPQTYRKDYGLPDSYPMVAPNYSEQRRSLAKAIGLGRRAGEALTAKPKGRTKRAAAAEA
ncbi:MucR family transcriptional regulator [Sphingomonas piscis]|uniref:MucR family transcriptional regulator n=1 Tax=Sphingomonas piscis TaxID=2714943 RepID=A0A6G7YMQ8_9SPHN|nr:MucR family transcriptional regulator [Sphingomonas piscis]QIK78029.1 MucR family transcriptional regulator [Sphingomonas piscis]